MEAITKVLDAPIPRDSYLRRVMVAVSAATAIGLFAVGFQAARQHGARIEAAQHKQEAIRVFDKATNFGEIWVRGDTCIRWNAGATALFGWTSKEMVGGDLSRLAPGNGDGDAYSILGRHSGPWTATGADVFRRKDGELVPVRLLVIDPDNDDELRRIIVLQHVEALAEEAAP